MSKQYEKFLSYIRLFKTGITNTVFGIYPIKHSNSFQCLQNWKELESSIP